MNISLTKVVVKENEFDSTKDIKFNHKHKIKWIKVINHRLALSSLFGMSGSMMMLLMCRWGGGLESERVSNIFIIWDSRLLLQTMFFEDMFISNLCRGAYGDGKGLWWTLLLLFQIASHCWYAQAVYGSIFVGLFNLI